ncbi:MAG: molybdopterin molybdenumtransferase MoeA [Rhodospirillales bacterium]|nr:molybdopterin molybdenumtransferase MoeA [Rhodospirillales bacterium]
MLPVAEAQAKVVAELRPVGAEQVSLADALGRVLAEDVASRLTQPPADVSAMDGYAVRAADVANVPARLTVLGESAAGKGFSGSVGIGQAARIFTGAPVPPGADTIVIQENTDRDGGIVIVKEGSLRGRHIRLEGLDFKTGQVLLNAGRMMTARDIGLAAAMNVPWLNVRRRPRVAIIATGNEVVMPGDPVGPDQIVSSNSLAVAAFVRVLGGEPVNLGIAPDEEQSLAAMVAGARGADILVTLGGISVGDHDLVRKVLGDKGLKIDFYKIAMRPGKPLMFGWLDGVPVLGLPGNPVSVGVTSILFLRPAIRALLGLPRSDSDIVGARLSRNLAANDQREDYLRSKLERDANGDLIATPFEKQDSSMVTLFAKADGLVIRRAHAPAAAIGDRIEVIPLGGGSGF